MSNEALWTVEFQGRDGWVNGGVIVLETGRVFGGDSNYYYIGDYVGGASSVSGRLRVTHYHGDKRTAWGDEADSFEITFKTEDGDDNVMRGRMERRGMGDLAYRMTKRANLP